MKKHYNMLFDKITSDMSDSELLYKALRKAEDMENKTVKRSIKKPFIALCAAVGVLAAGTVVVGAANNWDFNNLFGNKIVAETEQLGYELIGDAHDVLISCTNDDYNVSLNGVTGNANSIIASVEISRKDGKSMRELAASADNSTPDFRDIMLTYNNGIYEPKMLQLGYSGEISESGSAVYTMNISMQREEFSSDESLSDRRILMHFDDYGFTSDKGGFDIQIEFTYIPSEKSLEQLTAADVSAPCEILYNIKSFSETETEILEGMPVGRDIPLETVISGIDIRPIEGVLSGSFELGEYDWENYSISTFMCNNDVKLIRVDGTDIPVFLGGYNMQRDGSVVNFTMSLEYRLMSEATERAVDLSTVKAISINGTEYPLA